MNPFIRAGALGVRQVEHGPVQQHLAEGQDDVRQDIHCIDTRSIPPGRPLCGQG